MYLVGKRPTKKLRICIEGFTSSDSMEIGMISLASQVLNVRCRNRKTVAHQMDQTWLRAFKKARNQTGPMCFPCKM
jgi:hypothetical protein